MKLSGNERILIIKPSSLGDIIHALPLLHEIKTKFPVIKVSWLINREYAVLLEGHPLIDCLYIFDRKKWGKKRNALSTCAEYWGMIKKIRVAKFDVVIDLQGLLRSGLTSFLSGSSLRIGLSDAREGSTYFYTHRIQVHQQKRHAIERYLMVGTFLDIHPSQPLCFPLKQHDEDSKKIHDFLSKNDVDNAVPLIAVNPNARWVSKRWTAEKFARLSDALIEKYAVQIIFIGAPSEKDYVTGIVSAMRNRSVNAAGVTTLSSLGLLLEKACLFITNDSGPMHMGVAVGVPIVALFGPTDPEKTGPYGENNAVVHENECACSNQRKCLQPACMEKISIEQVIAACETFLKKDTKKDKTG